MRHAAIVVALTVAPGCASPAAPAASTAPPRRAPVAAASTDVAIPRDEIARRTVVPIERAAELLEGRWEGRRYDYDSERDFAGDAGDHDPMTLTIDAERGYTWTHATCWLRGWYEVEREGPDGAPTTTLDSIRVFVTEDCRGPRDNYNSPFYIHRLDDRVMVWIDGMTGGVSAFRRAD